MAKPIPIPMCRKCGYSLEGLLGQPGMCPECTAKFDPHDPNSYYIRPPFLAWRFWLPALLLSIGLGLLSTIVGVVAFKSWGWSIWFGVPAMVGCMLTYRAKVGKSATWILLALAILGLTAGLFTMSLAGVFCAIIVPAVFVVPVAIGSLCGGLLRTKLKKSNFSQRQYLPILLMFFGSLLWHTIDHLLASPNKDESVSTAIVIEANAATSYRSLIFYEDVTHDPPLIVAIALPRPLRTTGKASNVGDLKVCVYSTGELTKIVTEAIPGKRLAFNVAKQQIKLEHDIQLKGGSFEFEPIDATHTKVTLTTNYHPLLGPRFAWNWAERYALHSLHSYVLEGIRLRAEDPKPMGRTTGMLMPEAGVP